MSRAQRRDSVLSVKDRQLHVYRNLPLESKIDNLQLGPLRRYQDAAAIRDRLNLLQARTAELDAAGADRAPPPQRTLRLGQRVVHAEHGYRGAVFGCAAVSMVTVEQTCLPDASCCNPPPLSSRSEA